MNAYDAASQAAYEILQSCIASLENQIKEGEITDEESLSDAIHETADNALIYTRDQYILAWGLREEEDAIEEGLCEPKKFGEALAAQAYCNLRAAIQGHDFSDALAVAADALAETEGA
jgi:hypothetical protein